MPGNPIRQSQEDMGTCWCPTNELGPLSTGTLWQGPGTAPWSSVVGGGAAHSRQASTSPVDAASSLYYLVHPQRKSLQIPSFLPAAGGPPPGSGAKEWNLTLCPLPPIGIGLGGWRAGRLGSSSHVVWSGDLMGVCRWLKPSAEPNQSCGGLLPPPQTESLGWECAIVILGALEYPNFAELGPPGASTYPGQVGPSGDKSGHLGELKSQDKQGPAFSFLVGDLGEERTIFGL